MVSARQTAIVMLPPNLQGNLRTARRHALVISSSLAHQGAALTLLPPSLAHAQSRRHFWGWHRPSSLWSEQWDKLYHHRRRTLKTRARLLERLKHRSKFDWDLTQRPLFTSKHIRWASHWNGRNGTKCHKYWPEEDPPKRREGGKEGGKKAEEPDSDGYELSQREKLWKQQMEAMRNRIEKDPYEAVFGKRFEPFWSPLVPSWMREEMGLTSWMKKSETNDIKEMLKKKKKGQEASQDAKNMTQPLDDIIQNQPEAKATTEVVGESKPADPKPQSQSYSSYSSTSWDSWSNRARCTEWDSVSKQLKRYVYDPVTNRMVLIEEPKSPEPAKNNLPAAVKDEARVPCNREPTEGKFTHMDDASGASLLRNVSGDKRSQANVPESELTDADLTLPASKSAGRILPPHNSDTEPSTEPIRPAALSNLPENDLDLLTADDVRASMGKVKPLPKASTLAEKAALESAFDKNANASESEAQIDALLKEREAAAAKSTAQNASIFEGEQGEDAIFAEQELMRLDMENAKVLWKKELDGIHDEAQKGDPGKVSQQLQAHRRKLGRIFQRAMEDQAKLHPPKAGVEIGDVKNQVDEDKASTRLQTSLERELGSKSTVDHGDTPSVLQPALDRMQSKDNLAELDDSAAHESTEHLPSPLPINLPKDWAKQADLLQTDRIKRVSTRRPYPYQIPRWIDDMNARKAAWQTSHPPPQLSAEEVAVNEKLRRANEMLEAEVKEQKARMAEHEGKYAHKIRSLRQELETAYMQSAVHSEKHLERIGVLQSELEKVQKAAGESCNRKTPNESSDVGPLKAMQGEGDICTNITKFAGSRKWYKQPVSALQPNPRELDQAEQMAKDWALVKEVREIYENNYGKIDVNHQQPQPDQENQARDEALAAYENQRSQDNAILEGEFLTGAEPEHKARDDALARHETVSRRKPRQVVEVESDVDLGEALAEHEKEEHYAFRPDDSLVDDLFRHEKVGQYKFKPDKLEAEIQAEEREANEAQVLMAPENMGKMTEVVAENLQHDGPPRDPKLVSDEALKLNTAGLSGESVDPASVTAKAESTVQWEEPPVYKVLAYDSGNDKFSTATTTANFTGSESPISIPQALSQLYQPARFVPHFAELQQDGYQVIYGTRDLLVFKKVKQHDTQLKAVEEAITEDVSTTLHDHGLIRPMEKTLVQEAVDFYDKFPSTLKKAKEYDPTSIENGDLMPYEAVLAKEAANAYDTAREKAVNPIDGTFKSDPPSSSSSNEAVQASTEGDYGIKHYPRVRREERIFTGTRRKWNDRHERHHQRTLGTETEKKRRSALRWMVSVGFSAAALTYIVGVAAEAARQEKVDRERRRWQSGRW